MAYGFRKSSEANRAQSIDLQRAIAAQSRAAFHRSCAPLGWIRTGNAETKMNLEELLFTARVKQSAQLQAKPDAGNSQYWSDSQ
jgi:hypothetical protein